MFIIVEKKLFEKKIFFQVFLHTPVYCETVNEALSGYLRKLNGFLYVSDGFKWHRSVQFQQWYDEYNIELCEWPGYSPEFNAVDEALNSLSLNVIQACIRKTQKVYEQFVSSY